MDRHPYPPMLLTERQTLPEGPEWIYEPKLDGYRMIGRHSLKATQLYTRNGIDYTERYPYVVRELPDSLQNHSAIVDGEMVGFDDKGNPSFSVMRTRRPKVIYYIFDLIELDGEPLTSQPLHERRKQLAEVIHPHKHIQPVEIFSDRDSLLQAASELGLEGVVAKNINSKYLPGRRSKQWLKQILIKHTDGFNRH